MAHPTPVRTHDRIETLDVLRGFALLGILAMNIRGMAAPLSTYMYPYALFDYSGASRAAYLFTSVVFDLKMMGLFSMLFGAGVSCTRPSRASWAGLRMDCGFGEWVGFWSSVSYTPTSSGAETSSSPMRSAAS